MIDVTETVKVIRCKHCAYQDKDLMGDPGFRHCKIRNSREMADGYCHYAEPEPDEEEVANAEEV